MTIEEALRSASLQLSEVGVEAPRLEAEILLAHELRVDRPWLYAHHHDVIDPQVLRAYGRLVMRRAQREPVAYIVGEQEFWSLRFAVTPATLIPRPETELLVEIALTLAQRGAWRTPRVLDLGTGSGILAVTLAKEWPRARALATDRSWQALRVAAANAGRHGVLSRVAFVQADWLQALRTREDIHEAAAYGSRLAENACFDLILTNPPYVARDEMRHLPPEVRDFEPAEALNGGPDGMAVISRILLEAWRRLRPGGWLLCEIGSDQGTTALDLARGGPYRSVEVRQDLAGRNRVLMAQCPQ